MSDRTQIFKKDLRALVGIINTRANLKDIFLLIKKLHIILSKNYNNLLWSFIINIHVIHV